MNKNKGDLTQEEIWNIIAELWSKYKKKQYDDLKKFLKNKEGKILDLGCGSGRNFIKNNNIEFYGVDFSKEMLKLAKINAQEKGIDVHLIHSSASKLPFKNNFFNHAIYIAALHCIEKEKDRKDSLKELFRVLKKEGRAMITVWSKNHEKVKKYLEKFPSKNTRIPWKKEGIEYLRYYYIYDKDELEDLVRGIGFKIIESKENNNIILILEKP